MRYLLGINTYEKEELKTRLYRGRTGNVMQA